MKKNLLLIIFFTITFCSCKQNDKNTDIPDQDIVQKNNDSENATKFLREFYYSVYGSDDNNDALKKKYVSDRILKKIDSLTMDEDLILDYDPFIKAQDFDGSIIKKTLEVLPLKNKNEYRVSFLLFGNKDEKRTNIDFLLQVSASGTFLIYSILNDDCLNFAANSNTKNDNLYVLDSVKIQTEKYTFKISILENIENRNKENAQHNSNPIQIKRGDNKEFENNNLIYPFNNNCPADGFQRLVSKNNFFTIEQTYCKDFLFVSSYTTFKIDEKTGDIFLYKYGEVYTDRSNPDNDLPTKIKTPKDFGMIKLETVTKDFLEKLIN